MSSALLRHQALRFQDSTPQTPSSARAPLTTGNDQAITIVHCGAPMRAEAEHTPHEVSFSSQWRTEELKLKGEASNPTPHVSRTVEAWTPVVRYNCKKGGHFANSCKMGSVYITTEYSEESVCL